MIKAFFQKLESPQVILGRWCRTSKKLNDRKVDLANIDHCGTCVLKKERAKPLKVYSDNAGTKRK
jgi:hypothetical protein